jgi:hypothetical protein
MMRLSPALVPSFAVMAGGTGLFAYVTTRQPVPAEPTPIDGDTRQLAVTPRDRDRAAESAETQSAIAELRTRPLFTPGRHPWAPEPVVAADAPAPAAPPDLVVPAVQGIALSGGQAVAVVRDIVADRTRRVAVGALMAGWHITAISRNAVTFNNGAAEAVVHLARPGAKPRVETTALAPPPQSNPARTAASEPVQAGIPVSLTDRQAGPAPSLRERLEGMRMHRRKSGLR